MNAIKSAVIISAVISVMSIPATADAEDYFVIANRNVPVDRISRSELRLIYLGKKTQWNDNTPIRFYLIRSPKSQTSFLAEYIGTTPEQFDHIWMQNVFTGKGMMPEMFESSAEINEAVGNNNGSIGFTYKKPDNDNIKQLSVE